MNPGETFQFERNPGFPLKSGISEVQVRVIENTQRQLELAKRGEINLMRLSGPMLREVMNLEDDGSGQNPRLKKDFSGLSYSSMRTNELLLILMNTSKGPFSSLSAGQRKDFSNSLKAKIASPEAILRLYGPFARAAETISPQVRITDSAVAPEIESELNLKARLFAPNDADARRLAGFAQSEAESLGVDFDVSFLEFSDLAMKAFSGEADATLLWLQMQPAHGAIPWTMFFDENAGGFTALGEAVPGISPEIEKIRGIIDPSERESLYEELIRDISERQSAWITWASRDTVYLVPQNLKGEFFDWNGVLNFYEMDFSSE